MWQEARFKFWSSVGLRIEITSHLGRMIGRKKKRVNSETFFLLLFFSPSLLLSFSPSLLLSFCLVQPYTWMKYETIQPIGKAFTRNIGLSKFQTSNLSASQMQSSIELHLAREPYVPDPCSNNFLQRSFIYSAPCEWNKLIEHIKTSNLIISRRVLNNVIYYTQQYGCWLKTKLHHYYLKYSVVTITENTYWLLWSLLVIVNTYW